MILLDMMSVSDAQEAEALMFYHLRLAALLFEATDLSHKFPENEFSASAIRAWVAEMEKLYPEESE